MKTAVKAHIQHNTDQKKFYTRMDGLESTLQYEERADKVLDFLSTFVPNKQRHHNIGSQLVDHGLKYAKQHHFKVKSTCSFVDDYINRHPEYKDLREK